jgi:hypothetical protein
MESQKFSRYRTPRLPYRIPQPLTVESFLLFGLVRGEPVQQPWRLHLLKVQPSTSQTDDFDMSLHKWA